MSVNENVAKQVCAIIDHFRDKYSSLKEMRTGDGESDWEINSRVTKRCSGKR